MMHPVLADKLEALRELCRTHRVKRLELFGSAARDDFDPRRSDLDFLVEFQPMHYREHADCYFGLLHDLRELLRREVDLVEAPAVTNPYLLAAIERTRMPLYAAA